MKKIQFFLIPALFPLLFVFARCDGQLRKMDKKAAAPIISATHFDDIARLYAGLPLDKERPLYPLTLSEYYIDKYQPSINVAWLMLHERHIEPLEQWQSKEMGDAEWDLALYPLSGADFLNLYLMFPHAKKYLMFALEPAGDADQLVGEQKQHNDINKELHIMRQSLSSLLKHNYYYSRILRRDYGSGGTKGVLLPLLFFSIRLGFEIVHAENIAITKSGEILSVKKTRTQNIPYHGIRILLNKNDNIGQRELIYIYLPLQTNSLQPDSNMAHFLNKHKSIATLFKAALYLLFDLNMSPARNLILSRSQIIVQDDSGLPFQTFAPSKWQVQLYGRYDTYKYKIPHFIKPPLQTDLREAFDRQSHTMRPQELPFRFGYGSLKKTENHSNIMIARKKKKD